MRASILKIFMEKKTVRLLRGFSQKIVLFNYTKKLIGTYARIKWWEIFTEPDLFLIVLLHHNNHKPGISR